jgi:hypothetical protein
MEPTDEPTFHHISLDPNSWSRVADALLNAATRLETPRDTRHAELVEHSIQGVYYMLVAYALENYFKGTIIAIRKRLDKKIVFSHDLCPLATTAGIKLNKSEESLLKHLTEYAIWRGRYPIPTQSSDINGSIIFHTPKKGEEFIMVTGIRPLLTVDELHTLIAHAKSNLDKLALLPGVPTNDSTEPKK